MIRITNDKPRTYQVTTNTGEDIIVEWRDLPAAVIDCSEEGIKYIRIWSQKTKIFKAIGVKRLIDQFKDHGMYEQLKENLLTDKK